MFHNCERLHNILEKPMFSGVDKGFKDNPIFVSSFLYFVLKPLSPHLFWPAV